MVVAGRTTTGPRHEMMSSPSATDLSRETVHYEILAVQASGAPYRVQGVQQASTMRTATSFTIKLGMIFSGLGEKRGLSP